jgi:tetratricopeptide (TPR) repeat protein
MRLHHFAIFLVMSAALAASDLDTARKRYNHTDFAGAAALLEPIAKQDFAASELLGQSFYMLGEYKKSTDAFETAVSLNPNSSSAFHWLGRAYGRRAETSFPVTAVGYAGKARSNFEKAVQLDSRNSEAVNDLFEFYLQAPGFLGGGLDRAAKLADQIARQDAAEGNFAKARIAEQRKEYPAAETYLRRAMELAPQQPGRIVDLAKFLAQRGRFEESDSTFVQARKVAPDVPKVLFAEADTYIKSKRKVEEARELLKKYLASNISPDDPPKLEARKLLKQASGM